MYNTLKSSTRQGKKALTALSLAVSFSMVAVGGLSAQAAEWDWNAPDEGWYLSGHGGYTLLQDADNTGAGIAFESENDDGWLGGAALGYDFGIYRFELEGSYRSSDVDKLNFSTDGGIGAAVGLGALGGTSLRVTDGSVEAASLLANLVLEIPVEGNLKPYIGAGVGVADISFDGVRAGNVVLLDDHDTVVAYQGIAGVAYALSRQLDLTLDYRYFATEDPEFNTPVGATIDSEYKSHNVAIGLRWYFNRPAKPMPAVTPVSTRAPVPAPAPAGPDTFLVFFDWNSSAITPEARDVLNNAIAQLRQGKNVRINLTGHADRSGPADYNMGLSQRRADAVLNVLTSNGFNRSDINVSAKGETDPLVPTPDGVREPRNRRVEIVMP